METNIFPVDDYNVRTYLGHIIVFIIGKDAEGEVSVLKTISLLGSSNREALGVKLSDDRPCSCSLTKLLCCSGRQKLSSSLYPHKDSKYHLVP